MRTSALLFLALLTTLSVGCGKKGDPMPPLRNIPLTTSDLEIRQQGRVILFDMGYPTTTARLARGHSLDPANQRSWGA